MYTSENKRRKLIPGPAEASLPQAPNPDIRQQLPSLSTAAGGIYAFDPQLDRVAKLLTYLNLSIVGGWQAQPEYPAMCSFLFRTFHHVLEDADIKEREGLYGQVLLGMEGANQKDLIRLLRVTYETRFVETLRQFYDGYILRLLRQAKMDERNIFIFHQFCQMIGEGHWFTACCRHKEAMIELHELLLDLLDQEALRHASKVAAGVFSQVDQYFSPGLLIDSSSEEAAEAGALRLR